MTDLNPCAYIDHGNHLHHAADGKRVEGDTDLYSGTQVAAIERAAERRGYERRAAEEREADQYRWPCPGLLGDLHCTLLHGHANGHSFASSSVPQVHDTEARDE